MQYEENNIRIPSSIILVSLIQVAFLIMAITTIGSNLTSTPQNLKPNHQPIITIDSSPIANLELSNYHMRNIARILTDSIEINTNSLDLSNSKATIREGSITTHEFNTLNFKTLSFIADIPNLKQSYQIYYYFPIDDSVVTFFSEDTDTTSPDIKRSALCLSKEVQIIYPDFNCRSVYPSDARYQIIQSYINLLEFKDFSTSFDATNAYQINLKPFRKTTTALDKTSVSQVKHAISSLGISPDMFTYYILPQSR